MEKRRKLKRKWKDFFFKNKEKKKSKDKTNPLGRKKQI
jgi:hypothetical protein